MDTIKHIRKLLSEPLFWDYLVRKIEPKIETDLDRKIDNTFKLWYYFSKYISNIQNEIRKDIPFVEFITLDLGHVDKHILEMIIHDSLSRNKKNQLEINLSQLDKNFAHFYQKEGLHSTNFSFNADTFYINVIGHIDNSSDVINKISDFLIDFYLDFDIIPTIQPISLRDLNYKLTDDGKKSLSHFFYNKTLVYDRLT